MISYAYSHEVAKKSGSNFYSSFFFLPKEKRNGILAVYAFCRLLDDAVDEATDLDQARREIRLWRRRLDSCFGTTKKSDTNIAHPILPELSDTIRRFGMSKQPFLDLLKGIEMDFCKKRYATFEELQVYCYRVAGTVGLMCNELFGIGGDERARDYAVRLGTAFQLTNILRDVGSDARRGRVYLPLADLRRFRLTPQSLLERRHSDSFLDLMRFEAARAEDYFQKAYTTLPRNVRKKILPAEIMSAFYHRILKKLVREGFPVFRKKVALSKREKITLLLATLATSL